MDDLRGEDIHNLREHILHKLIDLRIAHTEHILIDTPIVSHLIGATRAAQLWIAGEGSKHVAWHINLRYYGNMACCSISHNLTCLSLCVIATIGNLIVNVAVGTDNGTRAMRAHLHQFRPFLDLDAPTLIVGNMPMEDVHVMQGQQVDELLHELHREEMTGTVKVHASPRETWCIGDDGCRQLEHLKQRRGRSVGE